MVTTFLIDRLNELWTITPTLHCPGHLSSFRGRQLKWERPVKSDSLSLVEQRHLFWRGNMSSWKLAWKISIGFATRLQHSFQKGPGSKRMVVDHQPDFFERNATQAPWVDDEEQRKMSFAHRGGGCAIALLRCVDVWVIVCKPSQRCSKDLLVREASIVLQRYLLDDTCCFTCTCWPGGPSLFCMLFRMQTEADGAGKPVPPVYLAGAQAAFTPFNLKPARKVTVYIHITSVSIHPFIALIFCNEDKWLQLRPWWPRRRLHAAPGELGPGGPDMVPSTRKAAVGVGCCIGDERRPASGAWDWRTELSFEMLR